MTNLSVNLNKIALLRNSRGGSVPDLKSFAEAAIAAGVRGLTVHPRADARRVALLARQARETFPDGANFDAATSWCGGRPATPDSKPLIGATPYDNLWLNTGHGALGFTLACGSAALLADAMAGRPSSLDASAFALMR